jgi:hypothetical protein
MKKEHNYDAFISYRHVELDKSVADRLQKLLEKYIPPSSIVPKSEFQRLRLFRDETELATSSDVSDEIKRALESSRFLIVLCSKSTLKSKWMRQEIEYWKKLHGGSVSNIITLLIEGEPSEVFPEELRYEKHSYEGEDGSLKTEKKEVEPLAANIVAPTRKEMFRKLKYENLRIIAPLLDCRFDDLYNRNQRRRTRRNMLIATLLIVGLVMFGIYSSIMMFQINMQRAEALINLEEANIQRAEADVQRSEALRNLEEVKFLLLSNAIDYAEGLNQQGARSRAGAVLRRVYENIDDSREDAYRLYSRFRDVAVDTLYYMDDSLPFARQELSGEIIQINVIEGHGFAVVTTKNYIYKIDLENGNIMEATPAPEGDQFLITNTYDIYILGVTDERSVFIMNTLTNEQVVVSEAHRYYSTDNIAAINYNEGISALTIVTYAIGQIESDPDSITYIPSEDGELLTKIILTIIPINIHLLEVGEGEVQRFTYKADSRVLSDDVFQISEDGRLIAYKNQFVTVDTSGDGWIRSRSTPINSDVTIVDIERFHSSQNVDENNQSMKNSIDTRFNEEEFFRISRFSISNQGVLTLDGNMGPKENHTVEYSVQRTIVYDSKTNTVLFNEQLANEYDSLQFNSHFLEVSNQYRYEEEYYILRHDGTTRILNVSSPEDIAQLEEIREEFENEYEKEEMTHVLSTDHWLLYLSRQRDGTFLMVYDLVCGGLLTEYMLPCNFSITHSFLFDVSNFFPVFDSTIVSHRAQIILVGVQNGRSKVLYLSENVMGQLEVTMQTLDVAATSGAIVFEDRKLLIGHRNGVLLMYNFGVAWETENNEIIDRRTVGSDNAVVVEGETTGIVLQNVIEGGRITPVSYSMNRTLMFGSERNADEDRLLYSIWDLETGEVITSFCSSEFLPENPRSVFGGVFSMQINSDFTYAIAEVRDNGERDDYIIDVSSGEVLHRYEYHLETTERIFYGIGNESNVMWVFYTNTLLLEEIDVSEGRIISQRYVSERIAHADSILGGYRGTHFNRGSDIIIFTESGRGALAPLSYVYSFISGRIILVGNISEIEIDGSAMYTSYPITRIALLAEELYNALIQSPFIGEMTEEDLKETGFGIFD